MADCIVIGIVINKAGAPISGVTVNVAILNDLKRPLSGAKGTTVTDAKGEWVAKASIRQADTGEVAFAKITITTPTGTKTVTRRVVFSSDAAYKATWETIIKSVTTAIIEKALKMKFSITIILSTDFIGYVCWAGKISV